MSEKLIWKALARISHKWDDYSDHYRYALREILNSPCLWCGYNGQGYWQEGTHAKKCPWHKIGGLQERIESAVVMAKVIDE